MNGFLHRSVLRTVQALGRASMAAVFISLVACGGGGSGGDGGGRRPLMVVNPTNPVDPVNPSNPSDPSNPTTPTIPTIPPAPVGAPPATVLRLNNTKAKTFSFSWIASSGATEYRLQEFIPGNPDFALLATLGPDVLSYDLPVTFLPSKINASYFLSSCNADGACSPSQTVTVTSDDLRRAIGYLKTSNTPLDPPAGVKRPIISGNNDVIDLSADGKTLALGEFVEDGLGTGIEGQANGQGQTIGDRENNSGAVYIYVNKDGVWSQQAYLKASNSLPDLNFGMSISLSADGNTLAVGAIETTVFVGSKSFNPARGAVYIFSRSGTTWTEQTILRARDFSNNEVGENNDLFGIAVSISGDGNTVAVGASGDDSGNSDPRNNDVMDSGSVYIFNRDVTTLAWKTKAYLKASNIGKGDQFGGTLSLSGDGLTLAVGAGGESSTPGGDPNADDLGNSGAVYVFASNGTDWSPTPALLKINTPTAKAQASDFFGGSISLSKDGRTLVAGASQFLPFGPMPVAVGPGTVVVFVRGDGNTWTPQATLKGTTNGDSFYTAALTDDGNTLLIGAYRESSAFRGFSTTPATDTSAASSGAAYLFTRNGTTWSQKLYFKASNTEAGDQFGFAVAIAGDGSTVAVLAPVEASSATGVNGDQDNNNAVAGGGAVYLY